MARPTSARLVLEGMTRDRIVGVVRDDLGVERIHIHRIRRPDPR